jgi:predicted PurR-regulated permease PerM
MLTVALLVAAVQFEALLSVLAVLGLYGAAQLIETVFLVPLLIGRRIALHPLLMIVAVIVGGRLFGLVGALLALPVTTVLVVVGEWSWAVYRSSRIYEAPERRREAAPEERAPRPHARGRRDA